MPRILGIDFGTRRIGCAVSDPRRLISTPLEVYERRDPTQDARYFRKLIEEHEVDLIVIGLPVHVNGREGTSARKARDFGDWLTTFASVPVLYHDERYSTVEADEILMSVGYNRKKRAGLRDMIAAQILLQAYLDAGCPVTTATPAPLADPEEL